MMGFSIIICCYNSSDRIGNTLYYISNLKIPENLDYEIVVVDNSSSDDTINVVLQLSLDYNIGSNLKIFSEPKVGLSNARICGIKNSRFEYLIFCDDDNWLFSNYLEIVVRNFNNPKCKVLGGMGIPISDVELPEWFSEISGYGYAVGSSGLKVGNGQCVYGAGMALRKSFAINLCSQGFNFLLSDRKGKSLISGGDSEICILHGADHVYFDDSLNFFHFLTSSRLNLKYYSRLNFNFGLSESRLFFYKLAKYNSDWMAFKVYLRYMYKIFFFKNELNNSHINKITNNSFIKGKRYGLVFNIFYFFHYRAVVRRNFSFFYDS